MNEELTPIVICMMCGKVKGEHRGWDISCELNQYPTFEEYVTRGAVSEDAWQEYAKEKGRVTRIDEPGEEEGGPGDEDIAE